WTWSCSGSNSGTSASCSALASVSLPTPTPTSTPTTPTTTPTPVPAPNVTVIESFGSTSLVQVDGNFYFYPVAASTGPQFKYLGTPVTVGRYNLSYIGVEQTASGYQVALRVPGADQYTVWNTDSNGNVVSNGTGGVIVSGSSSVLKSLEPSFQQDLNGDGVVGTGSAPVSGVCGPANGTTASSKPSTNLCSAGTASS